MGALQKIYELFAKVGEMRILVFPVILALAVVYGLWDAFRERTSLPIMTLFVVLCLALTSGFLYLRYLRPRQLRHTGETQPGESAAANKE